MLHRAIAISELEGSAAPVYVGQQVDAFIKRDEPAGPVVRSVFVPNRLN
jgi:hypothetical protein